MTPALRILALAALVLAASIAHAQPDGTPMEANIIINMTNSARINAGKRELKMNDKLMQIAQQHAEQMAKREFMTHSFDGSTVAHRAMRAGYVFGFITENVAFSPGYNSPLREIMDGWKKSHAHNRNMTNEVCNEIGVGVARSARGKIYACQVLGRAMPPGYPMPLPPGLMGAPMPQTPPRNFLRQVSE